MTKSFVPMKLNKPIQRTPLLEIRMVHKRHKLKILLYRQITSFLRIVHISAVIFNIQTLIAQILMRHL
ncbi:unnamed protein product [Trichobilharzia regenti]|nr:unnamed protein product [Trichobilharzia regenti]